MMAAIIFFVKHSFHNVLRPLIFKNQDTHFTEKLGEREGIGLSQETVRRIRREAGIWPKRKHRAQRHLKRRERKAQEGLMVLWNGSLHPWFGADHSPSRLLVAVESSIPFKNKTCGECPGPTVPLCGVALPSRQRREDTVAAADRAVIMSSRILTPSATYGVS